VVIETTTMTKKSRTSNLGTFTVPTRFRVHLAPFQDAREKMRALLMDIRDDPNGKAGVCVAIRVWETYPWFLFVINWEDAKIRKKTGADNYNLEDFNRALEARRELTELHKAASVLLMRVAAQRGIDAKPIAVSSELCRKVFRGGFPDDLNSSNTYWPSCVEGMKNLSDSERETVSFGQMQVERLRQELIIAGKPMRVAEPRGTGERETAEPFDKNEEQMQADKTDQASDNGRQRERGMPTWEGGILSFRAVRIKKFGRHPAPNQRELLDAFQAAGWPMVIQNPLRDANNKLSPRTLNETLRDLNNSIKGSPLRFEADGNGGCRWLTNSP
jgi:hypothetical protein